MDIVITGNKDTIKLLIEKMVVFNPEERLSTSSILELMRMIVLSGNNY